jgi:hypothetical protein
MHDRSDRYGVEHSAEVLRFRPREHSVAPPFSRIGSEPTKIDHESPDDLAKYERDRADDEHVDYRQRMLMNMIAVVIVTLLVGAGIWIADTIAAMERDQDCVLQGRKNCAPIEVPALKR